MKTGKIYFANIRIGFHSDINILTVKKTLYIYIYIPFLRKMQENFTYLDQLLHSVYA